MKPVTNTKDLRFETLGALAVTFFSSFPKIARASMLPSSVQEAFYGQTGQQRLLLIQMQNEHQMLYRSVHRVLHPLIKGVRATS